MMYKDIFMKIGLKLSTMFEFLEDLASPLLFMELNNSIYLLGS